MLSFLHPLAWLCETFESQCPKSTRTQLVHTPPSPHPKPPPRAEIEQFVEDARIDREENQ